MDSIESPNIGRHKKVVRDLQAAEYFRKGLDAAGHSSSTIEQETAIEHLSVAISLRSNQSRYFFTRAGCFRNLNEFQYAIEDLTMAISLEGQNAMFYATRASCYRKLGQIAPALEDYTLAIEKDARNAATHYFQRGLTLYEAKFYQESIIDFTKVIPNVKGSALEFRAYFRRGGAYLKLRQLEDAYKDLTCAIEADGKNPSGYNLIGQICIELTQLDEAIAFCTQALALQLDPIYYNTRGLAYLALKDNRKAFADFHSAVKLNGEEALYYFNRATSRISIAMEQEELAQDQLTAALDDMTEACSLSPNTVKYIHGKGLVYEQLGDYTRAIEEFRSCLKLEAEHIDSKHHLALLLHVQKQFNDAIETFAELETEPQVYLNQAMVFQETDQHEKALEVLEKGPDDDGRTRSLRGQSRVRLRQFEAAIEDLQAAIEYNIRDASVFNALGMAYRFNADHDEAISALTKAVQFEPKNLMLRLNRAVCFIERKEYEEAERDLKISIGSADFRYELVTVWRIF